MHMSHSAELQLRLIYFSRRPSQLHDHYARAPLRLAHSKDATTFSILSLHKSGPKNASHCSMTVEQDGLVITGNRENLVLYTDGLDAYNEMNKQC